MRVTAIAALSLALGACAGAKSTRIGEGRFAIECRRNATNCYEEAERVCHGKGYDVLSAADRSSTYVTATTTGNSTTATAIPVFHSDMLVECRNPRRLEVEQGVTAASTPPSTPQPETVEEEEDLAPPPPGAAGFMFGSTREDFTRACQSAGHEIAELGGGLLCNGTAAPLDPPSTATGRFCGPSLCSLVLVVQSSQKAGAALDTLQALRGRLAARYGEPTSKATTIPTECEETLAECLNRRKASVFYRWAWEDGFAVNLTVVVAADGGIATTIGYITASGRRMVDAQGL